ncbi:uncharacterized protein LOC110451542 [Mizuhopecten yessoensis]|uniref:uncharacterized protein LOC110451542 n=1 Tax=Mizuhopecten yessoensis TaxID=6573 RepID=UPI000B45BA0D|nr:uncharacterized protein LOC110451542 [Mizuhopecten yessoensis]XP_021355297.1 uncharacterized protein LOC110451542 [Mizuhopecten yessoensis]XP_021355298.1 uncharacterized protein LOC110451542 [Mizuhopecten yessoensis]XP_021355299.1 uncharacterized protein LOC110451542 [Mizuhopecten yessoensis]XP_021355300.1 uncharacterized protein LOC110451542 [Mizuhopecten yessoensis]
MSTAVLMSDTWKPTVIQLVPFANNKVRTSTGKDKLYSDQSKANTQKRSFPVLAVTRVSSGNSLQDRSSPSVNHSSHHKKASNDKDVSVLSSGKQTSNSLGKKDFDGGRHKLGHDKNNNNVNYYKEDGDYMMFNSQDLNAQFHGDPSACSLGDTSGKHSRRTSATSTDTRTSVVSPSETPTHRVLPKPSIGSARYFFNQQVKGIKPTPGEVELQRFRDSYAKDQAQKKKKYKLNVNQLPRSTTPINDHDPDKLNMKQVIQFLQNQKVPVKSQRPQVQLNKSSEKQMYLDASRTARNITVYKQDTGAKYEQQLFEKVVMHDNSRRNIRGSAVSRVSNTTAISTKSTPILAQSSDKHASGSKTTSTAKSMIERSHRVKRSDKRSKEFKLYRFLAVVPGNETKPSPVVFSSADSVVEKKEFSTHRSKFKREKVIVIPKEDFEPEIKYRASLDRDYIDSARQGYSESGIDSDVDYTVGSRSDKVKVPRTANVVHRKAKKHQLRLDREELADRNMSDSDMEDTRRSSTTTNGTIRLPTVNDFPDDQYSETEQDDDSVILRTVFNVNNDNNNNSHVILRHKPETEKHTHQMSLSMDNYNSVGHAPNPAFRGAGRVYKNNKKNQVDNGNALRKVMINIPDENTDQTDVIKLTLRKEKNATRQTSYMTDMVGKHSLGMIYNSEASDDGFDRSVIRISTVSMQQRTGKDQDDPAVNPSNSMAKSCIKVRQKLKANMYSE